MEGKNNKTDNANNGILSDFISIPSIVMWMNLNKPVRAT